MVWKINGGRVEGNGIGIHVIGDHDFETNGTDIIGNGIGVLQSEGGPFLAGDSREILRILREYVAAHPATEVEAVEVLTKSGAGPLLTAAKTLGGFAKYLFEHPDATEAAIKWTENLLK